MLPSFQYFIDTAELLHGSLQIFHDLLGQGQGTPAEVLSGSFAAFHQRRSGLVGHYVPTLFAARCAQVLGALVPFALDQPQAQPLKVARRQFVEGQGVSCPGDRRLGLGQGFGSCWDAPGRGLGMRLRLYPQRRDQPVIGFLMQTVAEDGAQVDVLTTGLPHLEVLPPINLAPHDELYRLPAVRQLVGDVL
jgi:hypothetical protein